MVYVNIICLKVVLNLLKLGTCMKKYDAELFLHDLSTVPWGLIEITNDPDDMVYTVFRGAK